jgi:hypothetical protein
MTDTELQIFVGKPIRATLADGRIIAGTLHSDDGHGHGHTHYEIVSDGIVIGSPNVREVLHGAALVVTVEDASNDPAAVE